MQSPCQKPLFAVIFSKAAFFSGFRAGGVAGRLVAVSPTRGVAARGLVGERPVDPSG